MIERTPLTEVGELPVSWIVSEAPPLIADIVAALGDPRAGVDGQLEDSERERAAMLRRLREGPGAAEQIPRDLAALQALLVESIRRETPERNSADFALAVERLAEIFGAIQGAIAKLLVEEGGDGSATDLMTGLFGRAQFDDWARVLLAGQRRYGHGFALAVFDIDGLSRINDAYGRDAGDRIVAAVAGVIRSQVRASDLAFRFEEDEFAVLAPHQDAPSLLPMAERIARLIASSQSTGAPRIAVAAGVVACPSHGETPEELVDAAAEAIYTAKASGEPAAMNPNGAPTVVQDP